MRSGQGRRGRDWRLMASVALGMLSSLGASGVARAQPLLEARVLRSQIALGEGTTLEVIARGNVTDEPEFSVPAGLELLGSGRMQNFSWLNGRASSQTVFRYELGANQAGQFSIGPFRVHADGQIVTAPAIEVSVNAASRSIGGSGGGPATLMADVEPREPFVGQPVILRVRLVQRAQLAEDPQYVPPATPGFWSEPWSRPESYYAAQGNERVLVTETRARLYPLASGTQTVGAAIARLALFDPGTNDPSLWNGGQVPRHEVTVSSAPVGVAVRALPDGAPAGFDGAVGVLTLQWSVDRDRTPQDAPATVRLEVRGIGNLPLTRSPRLASDDFEIFALPVEDSLGAPGQAALGRRTFQWSVLPRRQGRLSIPAPAFAWFDPSAGAYRVSGVEALPIDVDPPINSAGGTGQSIPTSFIEDAPSSAAHPRPWAFALGGLMLGAAAALLRRASRPDAGASERAQHQARVRNLERSRGEDFWRAADEASSWLEARGRPMAHMRELIAAARFGGNPGDALPVRRALLDGLARSAPRARRAGRLRLAAAALVVAAGGLVFTIGAAWTPGVPSWDRELGEADAAARVGDVARARATWVRLWAGGWHEPALAARLAWAEIRAGAVGPATAWVLAGESGDPRDAALEWVRERVREAGGLTGAGSARLPLRRLEWALAALALGAGAMLAWPRRRTSAALLACAALSACAFPAQTLWQRHADRAVVREAVKLAGTDIELESGQVVRILEREPGRMRIAAGRGATGWVPARAMYGIGELE